MMYYITNKDGSMYVHELRSVLYVSWVAKEQKHHALKFPMSVAEEWSKIISEQTKQPCVLEAIRPGQL